MHATEQSCETLSKVRKNHPKKGWIVDVDVYLYEVHPVDFEIETCLPVVPDPPNPNPKIVFHNSGRDGFTVRFRLFDNTRDGNGSNYVFPDPPGPKNADDPLQWALWSRKGHGCPPPDCHEQWDEFTSYEVQDQGTTLLVWNANKTATEFGYTLRVTNDDGQSFVELDPGGTNMNGSSRAWVWR